MTARTLTEIARAIYEHLQRFAADPKLNQTEWVDGNGQKRSTTLYWHPYAGRGGSRVSVRYVSFQGTTTLTRAEAEAYLTWLDAGNVGRHWDQQRGTSEMSP